MTSLQTLRCLISQRLCVAAEEIFVMVERILTEYEELHFRSKQQPTEQLIMQPHTAGLTPPVCKEEVSPEQREGSPSLVQEEPQPVQFKEEELLQQPNDSEWPWLTSLAVKSEDDRENRETEPLASLTPPVCKEEVSSEQQERSPSLVQEEPRPVQFKEEELLQQPNDSEWPRLTSLAVKSEDDGLTPPVCKEEVSSEQREGSPSLVQEEPQHVQFKEEELLQQPNDSEWPRLMSLAVKSEDDGENRETEPLASTSTEHANDQSAVNTPTSQKSQVEGQTLSVRNNHNWTCAVKNLTCVVCERSFRYNICLQVHMATHTRAKRLYACTVCRKVFALNSTLKEHMSVHTGGRHVNHKGRNTVRCTICCKNFATTCHLKKHMRTHTGGKTL